jgi:hypothetical protein
VPHLAWNTARDVHKYLEQLTINDCSVERIVELGTPPSELSDEDLKKLLPVHKIKIV